MTEEKQKKLEAIQKIIARYVATHPVGRNLALIGGFRYRFLDGSVRLSNDIDYHWDGELDEKQQDLIDSFNRGLFPEIAQGLGYSGRADLLTGPDADSPVVRVVKLSFWKENVPYSRIEIPVEITRIIRADPVEVRTAGGTVYATASEGDLIESKIIAIFGRIILRHRDIVDVFLFQNRFPPDTVKRLGSKIKSSDIKSTSIRKRINDLRERSDYHAGAVQEVIDSQFVPEAAAQLNDAGGGKIVLNTVNDILDRYIGGEIADEGD